VSESTTFAQACDFHNQTEVTLYLGFMRSGIGYVQSLICDHEGRLLHVHCDTEKMHTASPKSNSSHFWGQHTSSWPHCVHLLLQASLVSFAVNWSQWNNTTSNSVLCLPPEGGHSWCTGQSLCHQNSTFKTLCNNQNPNHSTSNWNCWEDRPPIDLWT